MRDGNRNGLHALWRRGIGGELKIEAFWFIKIYWCLEGV